MIEAPMVLLVDDDANDEALARIALEQSALPHQLHVSRDGAEAVDWLLGPGVEAAEPSEQMPHLILLDLKLPKLSGLEVLERVRSDARTKHVPVVVFTSSVEEKDVRAAYRLGANAYVRKPVDFREYKALMVDVGRFWLRSNQAPLPPSTGTETK